MNEEGFYVVLLSVHGLLRAKELELGRDADTGGQIGYVLELAKALALDERVARVDLVTRQIVSKGVSEDYSVPEERICDKLSIIRVPAGPKRYLKKEKLWPYLDSMCDQVLMHFRSIGMVPDVIHGHYADAGYVGAQLSRLLAVPFIFTGHSLGRVKKQRLLEGGKSLEAIEKKFAFKRRIEAEEMSLDTAQFVVASTEQEVQEQYKLYDHYQPHRMKVIPPGFDLSRFSPPTANSSRSNYFEQIAKFLSEPEKPMILAIARPDEKKNFLTLIEAFGESEELRERANLVLIAGNRGELSDLSPAARKVMRSIMYAVDRYDLYGSVAYPKEHEACDIPDVYRMASSSKGVFVNPALVEPFGLTLIEAAACGLPIVATDDGGPRDIMKVCENGILVNPLSAIDIRKAILRILNDSDLWESYSHSGITQSSARYTWKGHVDNYLERVCRIFERNTSEYRPVEVRGKRLTRMDRILVTGIDGILDSDPEGAEKLTEQVKRSDSSVALCYATGRSTASVLELMNSLSLPDPDILITSCGTEMYYGRVLLEDITWAKHIDFKWQPEKVAEALKAIDELELQDASEQARLKLSYRIKENSNLKKAHVVRVLRKQGLRANVIFSLGSLVDIVPIRASLRLAFRHLMFKWSIPTEKLLVCGFSGVGEQMLLGDTLGVVVGANGSNSQNSKEQPRIYDAKEQGVSGLLEGIEHYQFLDEIRIPQEENTT